MTEAASGSSWLPPLSQGFNLALSLPLKTAPVPFAGHFTEANIKDRYFEQNILDYCGLESQVPNHCCHLLLQLSCSDGPSSKVQSKAWLYLDKSGQLLTWLELELHVFFWSQWIADWATQAKKFEPFPLRKKNVQECFTSSVRTLGCKVKQQV